MTILSIALTSSRLHLIEKVIDRILEGSQIPDAIIVNFSEEGFYLDEGITWQDLPELKMVEYNPVENIGPMRTYIPVIERFQDKPDTNIIILDDDLGVSKHTIKDLIYWLNKLDSAVSLAGLTVDRGGKYFFKETVWSHLIKEPKKVHIHFAGWATAFKIKHLHKSVLDWRKYEDLGILYSNEPYLAYMLAKQGTDRYVIPSEMLKMYTSSKNLHEDETNQQVKERLLTKFYKTISGDKIGLTGKEIIYKREG